MSVGWFLEKNAKFYGPFLAEKVLSYAAAGKINKNTLVARDISGKDAKPYYQVEPQLRQGENPNEPDPPPKSEAPTSPQPFEGIVAAPMVPTTDASLGPEGLAKDWYVVTEDRRFGPYSLGHLESLVDQGKLKADDRLQREGQSHLVDVAELFPNGPSKKPAKPAPAPAKTKAKKVEKPAVPKVTRAGFRPGRVNVFMALVLGVILAVALALLWPKKEVSGDQLPGSQALRKLQSGIQQTSSLRRLATQAEAPPLYSALVEAALRDGLNFNYTSLAESRASDLKIYSQDGPKEFGFLFGDQIRREIRYALNGGNYYTYLVAPDGNIFAVAITHESFKRVLRKNSKIADFAADAREASEFRGSTWTMVPTPGVLAKAYWEKDKEGREYLRCLLVMNDPKLG